jgi:UDPglucose 6-dehydrogenase
LTPANRRIVVLGSWHQSSVLCACFAEMGYRVTGIADQPALSGLLAGRAPVHEPGLDALLGSMMLAGRLDFIGSFAEGAQGADFAFLSIDTPVGPDDQSDLKPIWRAVDEIAATAAEDLTVCVTSQVPVGTSERIAKRLGRGIRVAYVPEFLRLGTALETFRLADRFVIGADDHAVANRVAALYGPLQRPIHLTDTRSAEMAKHASNAWLATSVSFINQIADLCEQVGADVREVAEIMKLDRRVGPEAFLAAGLGYAGGTLGREIRALQNLGASLGVSTELFDAVDAVNQRRVGHVVERLQSLQQPLDGAAMAVFGLTYKAGTSTLRRSASLALITELVAAGARVSAYDPLAQLDEGADMPPFTMHREPAAAAQGAAALVLMAPWPEHLDCRRAAELMARPIVLDTGNHLDQKAALAAGLEYHGIGR